MPTLKTTTAIRVLAIGSVGLLGACGSVDDDESSDDMEAEIEVGPEHPLCSDGAPGAEGCIDEWGAHLCPVDTGYPGDDLALCGPVNGNGVLFHYGPKDYDDPDEIAKYLLEAGGEDENCIYVQTPNTETIFTGDFHGRMRPGSHHLIVTVVSEAGPDLVMNEPVPCAQSDAVGSRWLVGSQDPQIDVSAGGSAKVDPPQPGDPDYGAATVIPANAILRIDLHYLNPTDEEVLREAWVWMERVPEEEVEVQIDLLTWFQGSISIPPMSTGVQTSVARCRVPSDRYLGLVTGHFHENGTRFTVWHEPQGQEPKKIYETFNWEDPGNAAFVDRIDNPVMDDLAVGEWGAESGYLQLKEGDYVNFQCEFDNPGETEVGLGDQGKDQMCNVFGFYYPTNGDVWSCQCLGSFCF